MRHLQKTTAICLLVSMAFGSSSWAQAPSLSQSETTTTTITEGENTLSRRFKLTTEEHESYETLMQGPEGHWYRDLDPFWVLGIAAESQSQRMWYAHKAVEAEHQRAEREVAFQRAYSAVWKARIKDFPVIDGARWDAMRVQNSVRSSNPDTGRVTSHIAVYVHSDCNNCADKAAAVMALAGGDRSVDVYVAGASNDDDIRKWATEAGVDVRKVRARRLTLNHADAAIESLISETGQSTDFAVFRNGPHGLARDRALEAAE